jgi:hypothetical protein
MGLVSGIRPVGFGNPLADGPTRRFAAESEGRGLFEIFHFVVIEIC